MHKAILDQLESLKHILSMLDLSVIQKVKFQRWLTQIGDLTDGRGTLPANPTDLYSLYRHCRLSNSLSILEIGSGWSTTVLAKALFENREFHLKQNFEPTFHPNPYVLFTLDCSRKYLSLAKRRQSVFAPASVHYVKTKAIQTTFNGMICSTFTKFPVGTYDFIYLDGPAPRQVRSTNWFNTNQQSLLPMSADLLQREHFLLPGTIIIVDGRGPNAEFYAHNFKRNWRYKFNSEVDQHIFYLDEKPWGKKSQILLKLRRRWLQENF